MMLIQIPTKFGGKMAAKWRQNGGKMAAKQRQNGGMWVIFLGLPCIIIIYNYCFLCSIYSNYDLLNLLRLIQFKVEVF